MFTLKLYQNGGTQSKGDEFGPFVMRSVVIECVGIWKDTLVLSSNEREIRYNYVRAFRKSMGVADDGMFECYVGGELTFDLVQRNKLDGIDLGIGGNYYDYAFLENAQGKTTETIR
jgi:hypothetical protein